MSVSVFQAGHGKFTVAVRVSDGIVTAAYALCGAKDNFSRRVGRHKAIGRLDANGTPPYRIDLGDYHGEEAKEDVVKPIFRKLVVLDTEDFYDLSFSTAGYLPAEHLRSEQIKVAITSALAVRTTAV